MPGSPPFIDRSELFKTVATSIEQKHIRRHNEKPGVSRRDENRPSPVFISISNILMPLATEMFVFRKMLEENAQDYIFDTPPCSRMTQEKRETFDEDVKEKLPQFSTLINQLGHRVNTCDGFRNSTERSHLMLVHRGLSIYLKEIADFVTLLTKEQVKNHQMKKRSLADNIKSSQKEGYQFKYQHGLDELVRNSDLDFSEKLVDKLHQLETKYPSIKLKFERSDSDEQEYDLGNDLIECVPKNEEKAEEDDGWDGIDGFEIDEVRQSVPVENKAATILLNESVRNRRRVVSGYNAEQEQIRDSYEKWKEEQGPQFAETFQRQAVIMKEEFVSADRDDEMDSLEQHVADIQSFSAVLSEKVMDQERDIDMINDLAMHTTENLVDGNEWIRKAIANSASRRVILLFCIVVLTLTLLFLDWYNP